MNKSLIAAVIMVAASLPLTAQPSWATDFAGMAERAEETVEVTLDGRMLELAAGFLSASDPEERNVREIVQGLEGIYIYHFSFEDEWDYDKSVAEKVRRQMGSGWERMITVRSKRAEDVDVWIRPSGNAIDGLFIVAAEPREFTVVNIVGRIDLEKLRNLEGHFGIPELGLESGHTIEKRSNR